MHILAGLRHPLFSLGSSGGRRRSSPLGRVADGGYIISMTIASSYKILYIYSDFQNLNNI